MARMAIGFEAFKNGCTQGDLDRGVLPLGQCTGLIDDTPSVADVINRIVNEAETAQTRLGRRHGVEGSGRRMSDDPRDSRSNP